jgi:hypothetical protein
VADTHAISPEAAEKLEAWERRSRPAIILAALIPIIATVTARREGVLVVIDFVASSSSRGSRASLGCSSPARTSVHCGA